jgi:hypothetical protein
LVGECVLQKRFARAETADDVRAEAAVESAAKHWRGPRSRGGLDPTKTELAMAAGRRGMARRASLVTLMTRSKTRGAAALCCRTGCAGERLSRRYDSEQRNGRGWGEADSRCGARTRGRRATGVWRGPRTAAASLCSTTPSPAARASAHCAPQHLPARARAPTALASTTLDAASPPSRSPIIGSARPCAAQVRRAPRFGSVLRGSGLPDALTPADGAASRL